MSSKADACDSCRNFPGHPGAEIVLVEGNVAAGRKVNGEQWLPARATYTGSARVMLVKVMRVGGTLEFSDYRKFSVQTDTKIGKPQ